MARRQINFIDIPSFAIRNFFAILVMFLLSCSSGNDKEHASIKTNEELLGAIRKMDYHIVSSLIGRGADITYRDKFGSDALFYSVVYPHKEIFQLIIKETSKPNIMYEEHKNILHIAIESNLEEKGYFSFIKALVESNVEINLQDDHGNTPLWYASVYYVINIKTINLLLKKGADMHLVNKYGRSTFSSAKENDRKELLVILEEYNKKGIN